MTNLNNETSFLTLTQPEREGLMNLSYAQDQTRVADQHNDVFCAINKMGGIQLTARILGVSMSQIDEWIDTCYVPDPFAELVDKHTGYLEYSLQGPTSYIPEGSAYQSHRSNAD